jgi:hypothetical protein
MTCIQQDQQSIALTLITQKDLGKKEQAEPTITPTTLVQVSRVSYIGKNGG